MAKFKVVVSDPQTGKSQSIKLEEHKAVPLIGKKIGEMVEIKTPIVNHLCKILKIKYNYKL